MRHICFSLLIICCPVVSVSLLLLSLLDEGGEAPPPGEAVDTEKPVAVKTRFKKVSPGVYTSEVCTLAWYICGYNITWFWALCSRSWLERPPGWEISPQRFCITAAQFLTAKLHLNLADTNSVTHRHTVSVSHAHTHAPTWSRHACMVELALNTKTAEVQKKS